MIAILKNPITLWLKWLWGTWRLKAMNKGVSLDLKYMAVAEECKFGRYNTLYEGVALFDSCLGDFTYIATGSRLSHVTMGKFCSIGPYVLAGLGRHPSRTYVSSHPAFYSTQLQAQITFAATETFKEFDRIEIGHDVWVGARAVILDGIRIGNGAIVGAGAVVTKDVPPYAVVAGVPARVVRRRFTDDQILFLEESRWWDKEDEWFRNKCNLFSDIDKFRAGY